MYNPEDIFIFKKPFRIARQELERVKRWYLATMYAYNLTVNQFEDLELDKSSSSRNKVVFEVDDREFLSKIKKENKESLLLIAHDESDMYRRYTRGYLDILKETTLVRIVTILEVFLSELIKSIFHLDKKIFLKDSKLINVKYQTLIYEDIEFLQEKYINDLVRSVANSGFDKIKRFYAKQFEIFFKEYNSFTSFSSIESIKKMHQERHLIVHRYGGIDDIYKKTYKSERNKLKFTKENLLDYLYETENFIFFIEKQVDLKIIKN